MPMDSAANPMNTRASLMLRLKAGDQAREVAWGEFYRQYAPMIRGFGRKMHVKAQELEDLVQEVLTGFFAALPKFVYDPAKGRFRGYLKTCTWNVMRRRWSKQLKVSGQFIDEIDPDAIPIEETWNDIWESEKLRLALEKVRDHYLAKPDMARTFRAFEMYVLLERPPEIVAQELAMPTGDVYKAKQRISQAIKIAIEEISDNLG